MSIYFSAGRNVSPGLKPRFQGAARFPVDQHPTQQATGQATGQTSSGQTPTGGQQPTFGARGRGARQEPPAGDMLDRTSDFELFLQMPPQLQEWFTAAQGFASLYDAPEVTPAHLGFAMIHSALGATKTLPLQKALAEFADGESRVQQLGLQHGIALETIQQHQEIVTAMFGERHAPALSKVVMDQILGEARRSLQKQFSEVRQTPPNQEPNPNYQDIPLSTSLKELLDGITHYEDDTPPSGPKLLKLLRSTAAQDSFESIPKGFKILGGILDKIRQHAAIADRAQQKAKPLDVASFALVPVGDAVRRRKKAESGAAKTDPETGPKTGDKRQAGTTASPDMELLGNVPSIEALQTLGTRPRGNLSQRVVHYRKQLETLWTLPAESKVMTEETHGVIAEYINDLDAASSGTIQGNSETSKYEQRIKFVLGLPWIYSAETPIDLDQINAQLDEDHYGLDRVKERIINYMAVRALLGHEANKAPILCLYGPPGVGKTSIGISIARALKKKLVRIPLGGVRDEAKLRGHNFTYQGAQAGKILRDLRKAKEPDGVFLLDEIDKLGKQDHASDIESALLEVLDPEQNVHFTDHYADFEFPLNRILFIATANNLEAISGPLRDRMELINLAGYDDQEKLQIAKRYLVKKAEKQNGLAPGELTLNDEVLLAIINGYTEELGVRQMEKQINKIARKLAAPKARAKQKGEPFQAPAITVDNLADYLGRKKVRPFKAKPAQPGLIHGLSVSGNGGHILPIACTMKPLDSGKQPTRIQQGKPTGNLKEVMSESTQRAFDYIIESILDDKAEQWGVELPKNKLIELGIGTEEGSIPKDGPSAGLAFALLYLSKLSGRAIRNDIAITGEISLKGYAMPIGGLREKLTAACKAGLTTAFIPEENLDDLEDEEFPNWLKEKIDSGEFTVKAVSHFDELVDQVLLPKAKPAQTAVKFGGQVARPRPTLKLLA